MIRAAVLTIGAIVALAAPARKPVHSKSAPPNTLIVKMVDKSPTEFAFDPSVITARPGDVVRFEMTTTNVHNVDFKVIPSGADLGTAKTSGFMTSPTQTFEVTIDKRFPKGTYAFICTPHEAMGMKGTLIVTDK